MGISCPIVKFLAAQSRQAGRKTKRFFSILSQEADIKAAQREVVAATNGVGLPPKPLISEAALKAASLLFATGAILANAQDNGSGSGSGSTFECVRNGANGKEYSWWCNDGQECCHETSGDENIGSFEGYCCNDPYNPDEDDYLANTIPIEDNCIESNGGSCNKEKDVAWP